MPRANVNQPEFSFAELTRILTPRDGDYVTLDSSGRLQVRSSRGSSNRQNRQLMNRILQLFTERMDAPRMDPEVGENALTVPQKEALKHYFLYLLEMPENGNCPAISMKRLRQAVDFVNVASSELVRVQRNAGASPVERRMAEEVARRLSAAYLQPGSRAVGGFSEYQHQQTEKLRELLNRGHRQGIPTDDISTMQLRTVANGRLFLVQNLVYRGLQAAYNTLCSLNHGQDYGVDRLLSNEELMSGLFAYAIRHEAALSRSGRKAEIEAMKSFVADKAFALSDRSLLLRSMDRAYVSDLMRDGSEGLLQEVNRRRTRKRAWRRKTEAVNRGTQSLQLLSDRMQRLRELQKQAVGHGLSHEQAEELRRCGRDIDGVLYGESWPHVELVAGNMSSTRFAPGVRKLKEIKKSGLRYAILAENMAQAMELQPAPEAAVQPAPEVVAQPAPEIVAQPVPEAVVQPAAENINRANAVAEELAQDVLDAAESMTFDVVTAQYGIPTLEGDAQRPDAGEILDSFTGPARDVAAMLLLETDPSALIGSNDEETLQSLESLYRLLRTFDTGAANVGELNLKNVDLVLSRSDSGNVVFRIGNQEVPTIYSPAYLRHRMEEDICANLQKYGMARAESLLNERLVQTQLGESDGMSRGMLCDILRQITGIPAYELTNVSTPDLSVYAQVALQDKRFQNRNYFRQALLQQQNRVEPELNEQDTLETLRRLENLVKEGTDRLHDRVEYTPTERKRPEITVHWTEEEAAVQRFLADMISPLETWQNDLRQRKTPEDRMRYTIFRHADTLAMMLQKPQILDGFNKKLGEEFEIPVAEQMQGLFGGNEEVRKLLMDSDTAEFGIVIRGLVGNRGDLRKAAETLNQILFKMPILKQGAAEVALREALGEDESAKLKTRTEVLEKHLMNMRAQINYEALNDSIEKAANAKFATIQDKMDEGIKKLYSDYKPLSDKIDDLSLTDLLKDNVVGNAGQARYMRKVLGDYFKNADPASRREMLASAFRELIPAQPGKDGKDMQRGSAMSGLFKGAGPLFQKTLQGLPTEDMPTDLRQALDDVKSRLRSIDPAVVTARLNQLVEDSKGTITKISVERSLGAASVGEAFLCRIYGPALEKDGREAVIKLLRPDVKNRMEREKPFFLQCAKDTDEGMAKTIAGQLEVYEKELDLRLEAKNIQRGVVYNKGDDTVKSERLITLVRPQANALMLEKASGTTVGNYFKQVQERLEELKTDESPAAVVELGKLYADLKKRQGFLSTLAKKWVTQGIFESGFYQADLHKDNIMIDDKQATIIDYGNATQLSAKQREKIMKMVFAATLNTPKLFVDNYGELVPKASHKLFKEKRDEFEKRAGIIFSKQGDPGTKIAVALCEAQKLGLELPSSVYNFSMGQIRLKNTMEEGNNLLRSLANEIKRERHQNLDKDDPFYEIYKELDGKQPRNSVYDKYLVPKLTEPKTEMAKRVEEYLLTGKNERFNAIMDTLMEEEKKKGKQLIKLSKQLVLDQKDPVEREGLLNSFRTALARSLVDYDLKHHDQTTVKNQVKDASYEDFFDVMNVVVKDNLKHLSGVMGFFSSLGYGFLATGHKAWDKVTGKKELTPQNAANEMKEDLENIFEMDGMFMNAVSDLSQSTTFIHGEEAKQRSQAIIHSKFYSDDRTQNAACIPKRISRLHISDGLKRRLLDELGVFADRDRVNKLFDTHEGMDRLQRGYKLLQSIKKNMAESSLGQQVLADNASGPSLLFDEDLIKKYTLTSLEKMQPKPINSFVDGFEVLTADGLQQEGVLTKKAADKIRDKEQDRETDRQWLKAKGFVFLSKDELEEEKQKKEEKKEVQRREKKTVIPEGRLEEDDLSGLFGKKERPAEKVDLKREPEFYFNYQGFVRANPESYEKINSNDIEVLESLKDDVTPNLNRHLSYRIGQLKRIQDAAEDGNERGPVGLPQIDANNQRNIVLPKVEMAEKQNSGNGCWSVSLASQLAYRGVHLDQRTIRAYRPDTHSSAEKDLLDANADLPNSMPLYTELVQKLLPNTAVNAVEVSEVSRDEARLALENCLQRALGKDNSPVSFLCNGHYRTIYGIKDGNVLMYDSLNSRPDKVTMPLDQLLDECKSMSQGSEKYIYNLQWLQDLKLNAHGEPELPDSLKQAGVKYLGGSMAESAQGDALASRSFRGFTTERVNHEAKIVMILPKQLKTKAIDGFYPEALQEIHDKAKAANVPQETLELLNAYPRERPNVLIGSSSILEPMMNWAERLQQAYAGSDDASKAYIHEALEELKNSLILQEKLKLRTEIREKLYSDDNKIYYEPEKAPLFQDALAKALWISKFEKMQAENAEWVQQAKPGAVFMGYGKTGTLAPGKEELRALAAEDQYGPLFRELAGISDVTRAQLQPAPGFENWTVACDDRIRYVSTMKKLAGDLDRGTRLTDSLDGLTTEFARQQEAKAAARAQAEAEKAAFKQAKDNVFAPEAAAAPERRNSLKGNYRITSEELAKKLDGDKKAPENKQKLIRRNSFTPSLAAKNKGMQK